MRAAYIRYNRRGYQKIRRPRRELNSLAARLREKQHRTLCLPHSPSEIRLLRDSFSRISSDTQVQEDPPENSFVFLVRFDLSAFVTKFRRNDAKTRRQDETPPPVTSLL